MLIREEARSNKEESHVAICMLHDQQPLNADNQG